MPGLYGGRRAVRLGTLLAALWLPGTASSIVNIEDQRPADADTGLHGRLELGLNGDSGNSERSEWHLGGRLLRRTQGTRDLLIADYTYGQSQGRRNSNRAFLHLRHGHALTGPVSVEGFAQVEQDEFARLRLRTLLGGGLRWSFDDDRRRQRLGLGVFRAWERIADAGLADPRSDAFWRANLYWHYERPAGQGLRLSSTLYVQPRIGPMADLRLLEDLACELPLVSGLRLRLGFEIIHDSRPPLTVEQTDVHYRTDLTLRF